MPRPRPRTEDLLEAANKLAFDQNAWFRFPLVFLQFLPISEAMVLAFLLSDRQKYEKFPEKYKKYKGWFYYKSERITRLLKLPRRSQYTILRGLSDKGYIATKLEGLPPKKYISVNLEQVYTKITEHTKENEWEQKEVK